MALPKPIKWGLLTLAGILLVLILSVGLWIRLRTVSAVRELVETLSDGQYGFKAGSIRVDPFHLRVKTTKLHVFPLHKGTSNSEFELKADSLSLELDDVVQLLFRKKLNVASFSLINPSLELRVQEKEEKTKQQQLPLHVQAARIQEVFFKVLESLKVKKFNLRNGAIAYYPELTVTNRRYFLNHINLSIDNLRLLEKFTSGSAQNKAGIHLELINPKIESPDSTILIDLKYLDWNTRSRHFEVTGLGFHKSISNLGDSSGFRLEGIALDSMNWHKLLTTGVVELGELSASKGYFLTNTLQLKKKHKDSSRVESNAGILDILGPILIHKLSIGEMEFVGNTHTVRGKETIRVKGDHLDVLQLVIDNSLPNKVSLEELNLQVKAYMETDSSRNFQSGFGDISIQKNDLILRDYYLQTQKTSRRGENRINIKSLVLKSLSIPDLFNGKLKASELVLNEPMARLMIPPGKKKKAATDWERLKESINKKLDIGTIRINNAAISILKHDSKVPLFKIDSFFALISSRAILHSVSLEELFAGQNAFAMPRLALRLPNLTIDCKGARYVHNSFYAESAQGSSKNDQVKFKLRSVSAKDINIPGILHQQDSGLLRLLDIGSGEIFIALPNEKKPNPAHIPSQIVRTIHTGPIALHVKGKNLSITTQIDSILIDRLKEVEKAWTWQDFMLKGKKLDVQIPGIKGKTGDYLFAAGVLNSIWKSHWEIDNEKLKGEIDIPVLEVRHSTHSTSDLPGAVDGLIAKEAAIHILLKENQGTPPQEKTGKKTRLPAITLLDPKISLRKIKAGEIQKIADIEGGRLALEPVLLDKGGFETNSIEMDLRNIRSNQENYTIELPSLKFHSGKIRYTKGEPVQTLVRALAVQQGRLRYADNNQALRVEGLKATLNAAFRLNTSRDSLKRLLTALPNLVLQMQQLQLEQGGRNLQAYDLKIASDKKQISFDSLQWTGTITRDSFFKAAKVQKDFIQLQIGPGLLDGYNMLDRGKDTVWSVKQLTLTDMRLLLERNKKYPLDTISYRPMLTGLLQKLPLAFSLERVLLKHAGIRYNEISDKEGREGSIWFTDINASVRNLRNIDLTLKDSLLISAKAGLMGKADLRLSFRQSYLDSLQGFFMLVRMGQMEFNALAPFLLPLYNLKIDKGTADSLWLRVKANDYLAFGKMELRYRNLKLSLLRENGNKRKFLSFIANTVLKSKNDNTGLVYRERLRNKSMFNYWGKIAMSGLLTNLGVQKNKKQTKKYKAEMKSLQLPESLLEE